MNRAIFYTVAVAACALCSSCVDRAPSEVRPKAGTSSEAAHDPEPANRPVELTDFETLQGLWLGSWGGGEAGDGVVFQPVIAELRIHGDRIEMVGFRNADRLVGTFRLDTNAKTIQISRGGEADGAESKPITYSYDIRDQALTLTDAEDISVTLMRHGTSQTPTAGVTVELVSARRIGGAGALAVTDILARRAVRDETMYFHPQERLLKVEQATVLQVEEAGVRELSVEEARSLLDESLPVVVAHRGDEVATSSTYKLWNDLGRPAADSQAVRETFLQMLRPGTLVFVLPPEDPAPPPP